jgi:amino acid adenylation domain-containing protein
MTELAERLAKLTPAQRKLLELRRAQQSAAAPAAAPATIPARGAGPAPLSFSQRRLWFLDRLEPGSAFYNLPSAVRLGGALDVPAMERALGEIVRRHEALRTVFAEADGAPVQVVAPFGGFALPVEDLSGLGEADREAALAERAREEAARPFDLAAGPLFRAALLRMGAEDHVLLVSVHHIVSDGWSMGVLFGELSALYSAYREGRESPLVELPVQYADYAAWQREQLAGDTLERQLAYWRERLADAPALLELPADHPRPAVQTYRGATLPVELSLELMERLQALGRSEGATLYMVLLGAFQVLLSKYSGSEDVVVGSPTAGRPRKELEELIGLFVNTLVLRADLSGDPSFREVLRRVREATLGAYAHQELPFENLVAELQPERSLSHSPLFQVMFTMQNLGGGGGGSALAGLSVRGAGAKHVTAQFDLSLDVAATSQGLRGGLNYSTDLFERGTAERMVGHLARVLEQVAADADVRLSRLALAGPEERAQVVVEWNRTERPFPDEACIHQLFQGQAERTPGAAALVWGAEELTYRELDARANRLAHHLAGLGVGPESRVGLRVERSVENVVATLAVLKAGGCCVPVDTSYPAERMALMLADSGVRVLLSDGELAAPGLHVIRLDQVAETLAAGPDHAPPANAWAGNLAYVFYTSGSTGRPKGVMMAHREVVQYACCLPQTMPIGPGDRIAQASNASFDAAVFEIWGALLNGATLVGIDRDVLLSAPLLGRALREQGITHLYQTAALFNQHVREQVDVYAGLRQLVFGAEAVGTESVRRMLREGKPGRVLHEYGPTEATVWCTLEEVGEVAEDAPTVLIGKPIPNARGYVLDPAGEPLPVGVLGELCIGGDGVVRGYLGRPGLTAERFVPDPFATEPGARMYRTGDRVRWRAEGKLEFMGRLDDQVKIRGFRIEPGEVEAAMAAYPGVREARVMMREDQPGDKRLVAYVVGSAEVDGLRAHLLHSLPEYMVPRAIVVLDRLPLNANGKVDRKALPVPEYASSEETYVAPRTPVEEVLAGIWAETLRLERVGVEESFFELGGHSLLATRVVSRVRELFAVELPLRAFFEGPTVAELAGRVEEMRRAGLPVLPPVVPVERTGPLPLSFAQERLWFIDRLDPGSATYNIPGALRLTGALDEVALERSLSEIIRRHEALRTVFAQVDGSPVQVIAPFGGFTLPVEDLSGLGEADREAAARRRAGEEARRAFDLSAGPLFRAVLLRLGAEEHVLLLSMHHIVSDGWSLGVLFREFSALYEAYRAGRESPLAELPVQYADYAVWQRQQLEGAVLERQLAYWRERLAGAPELLELPVDHPRPAVRTYRGASVPVELSAELLERLQALGRSEGATLYMTLLAAFQVLLSRYGGGDDVVVGSPIAGRTRGEVEALIGFFVNTLVLRTDLSGDPSFRETLRRAREATLGAYEHQEVPFERLVAELQPERSLGHSPLFQVMFTLENAGGGGGALAGLQLGGVAAAVEIAKFDLSLTLAATPQGLRGELNYGTDLFERGTIVRMLGHLERVLEQVAADADVRLSRLQLLGEAERAGLLALGEGAAPDLPRATTDALFARAAAAAPDAVALAWEGGRMTYAELDGRANRLAHHLRRAGVAAGSRVGVCLERGPELVVATLAALKAGGAYVPLDPAYPAERLAFMLADTAVPVLVTESPLADRLPPHAARVVRVDADAAAIAAEPADAPAAGTDPEAAAYVMYTSGSTGRPKGVEVPHRAIVRLVHGQDYVSIDPSDVFLQLAPASFDAATLELWGPLLNGARLALHPAGPPTVESIGRALEEHGVTVLWLTAGLFHLVVEERIGILRGVRQLLAGGDVLSVPHVRRVLAELPETALINGYGPTENTVFTCCHRIAEAPRAGASIPVGRPIANTYVRVLDGGMQPVPVGVPGELYAGGAGLALGYLGRPELTAETFVADPYLPGARLYRTGDRVRWRESSEVRECVSAGVDPSPANSRTDALPHSRTAVLEFLGRVDTQVKIRGFRVEPGEVEAVLRAWPGVREAAVVVREDAPGDRRLVAYVAGEVAADELREHLRGRLPEHMLPSAFVVLETLPLTLNGKLDRRALPAPDLAPAEEAYVAPRTPVEEVLAGIWAEVLRVERAGVEESFFALGGHSLLATRVVSRIREVFGVELPLRALFEGPTVAELAGRVEEMRRAELPVLPPVVPADRTGPLPLSFAQERLWFLDRLEPGSATYNVPVAWRLAGALDGAALERSLSEIVRRHEALRTVFMEADESPVQVIAPFAGFALPVEDLSGLGEADREAAVGRRAGEEASRPFDLSAGPLFRAALLRLGDEDHVLLLSMHHIVSDGWSMGVLLRELSALYEAYREGRESPLAELPVQYADYAVWQREQLAGETLERQLAYWRERLSGAPELLELPTDRPRPAVRTYGGATVPVEFSLELLERLQALGRSEGATLYMTLLGAFQVLLSRYSGSEDVVVGSPIAGRTRKEVEELIGFFVNTLVLRTDLSGDPSFRETLRRVREATLGAYEHQEVPFEKLVTELQPERSLSHSPLFQVNFTLQDAGGRGGGLAGLQASGAGAELASAKFDLSLGLTATPRGLLGEVIYRTDLFDPGTVEGMVRYLERVLEQVAADADVRLSQLDLLGEAERARVLQEGSRTAEVPADRCIHALFQAQAARTPDAVALTFGAESVTYAELDARANGLAHHLLERGARPDSLVGLLVERSVQTVAGILGILKAGAGYLPLDPADPDDRLAWVLDDSGAPIVVTTSALAPRLAGGGVEVVRLDRDVAESAAAPEVDVVPGSLAYVIYTSGSTGRPKGVQVTHANVVRLFAATDAWFGFDHTDVWTLFHSYAFDFSVWEIWGALLYGGRLVVVPFGVSRSPEEFYALLESERVTVLNQTPSAFRQLMRADEEAAQRGEMRELALRSVVFGGEALDPAILRGWVERRGDDRPLLVNMYGITETTVHVTYRVVREADVRGGSSSPIGVPIPDLSVHLLDRNGRLVPTGMVGEMYVGGGGVARGYLHRPELTAERFVRDPFSADPAARLYRSGDLARRRTDGSLEFMGRADDQVKVRGFRIELREIESVLLDHPGVREAVVLTRGEGEEKRLVAWFVAAGEVAAAELRAHLLAHLPGHMVPSAFVRLDALPLTRNGKTDRRALPEPDAGDLAGTDFVAPGTPTEEVLAALWAQLLGAERVGATDDFFTLGGHSLLATRLASRVRSDLRVELPIRAVFEHTSLGALAAEVERLRRGAAGVEAPPIVPVSRDGDLPLSLAQERLWFVDRMEAGSATYHMPLFVRLEGALDDDAFRRALDELVRRHESLRTSFPLVDGIPVQRVAPAAPAEVTVHDLSALRDDEREDEAARLVREQARTPFWLETGPLFRADLVKLGEDAHLFLATLHHAIADGWSLDLLWHELAALYGAFSRGEASPLPEPRIQYGDFSVWQRGWLQGEVLERELAFWRRALEGAPPLLALPADRPRPAVQTHAGALAAAVLPRQVADAVLALARQEGATLFMVLMASLDLVLSRQSGQEDVVVGTPIAGRTRAETDRVVGLFLNSLALRVSLAGDPAFRELLRRVRDTTLDAYAHQDAPFEAVLEEIQPERALDRTPVFQVMLNLANFTGAGAGAGAGEGTAAADAPSSFPGLRVRGVDEGAGAQAAKFDFTLYAGEQADGIGLQLVYNTDLYDAGRMAALLAQLVAVLRQAVEEPGRPVSRFVLADGRAPSDADRELRTAAGLPAGVGEPGEVWERRDGRWAATGERGRYLPDGSIAAASLAPVPEARTEPAAPAPDAGAALTETEREMLEIWSEVLDEPVELHDDFFELGGHSLLGVRLLALVKKRLGRTLALPVLFGASTPALLSARVDDTGEGRGFVHLVAMGGEESVLEPIFLVHPAGGTVFKYADLARNLGDERPIYAIQAAGVTDGAEPLRTVDLMAQAYLEEVLRLQPQGPYYLTAWSAGGVIAVEMAHRLRAAGHEVALVGLLDSSPPNADKPVPDPVHLYRRLAAGLSGAERAELDALEDEMRGFAIDDRLPYLARWLAAHGAESRVHELDGLKPVVEVFRAIVAAARRHPLAPYPGRVTLFCAEEARGEGWEKLDLPGQWKPFVSGELEVVVVPGSHITMVGEPHVRGVAAAIRAAMARS